MDAINKIGIHLLSPDPSELINGFSEFLTAAAMVDKEGPTLEAMQTASCRSRDDLAFWIDVFMRRTKGIECL
jgi:hypothetical protein